jgi:predicted dehydrogenase
MSHTNQCRWGFLSTASIGRKNWQAVRDAGNAAVTAVASRSVDSAQKFIAECQAECPMPEMPKAYGSYDELIASPDVDAVYVPLPTGLRKEWILKAAAEGKHVLIEKPAGDSAEDVAEMIEACAKAKVQFMDGVMYMHSSRLPDMRAKLDAGAVGDIRRITAQFSFHADAEFVKTNIRTHSVLESMGALGDLGWYTSRWILWAMNWQMPKRLTARIHSTMQHPDSPSSVPAELSAEMEFSSGVSASMHCSFVAQHCQLAMVSGTKGYLMVQDYVLPFDGANDLQYQVLNSAFGAEGCKFTMAPGRAIHQVAEIPSNGPGSQESRMIQTFSANVLKGQPDPFWPELTLKTQRILDACLKSGRNDGESVSFA